MCIIASIPAGSSIDESTLNTMWESNSDGGGIAYIEDGKIKTYKSMKLKKFRTNFFDILDKYGDSDILVHTRIATHGSVCIPNVHPFPIMQNGKELDNLVFAHNGILPSPFLPPAKLDISDTRYINDVLFNGTDFDTVLDDSRWQEMIGDIIGHNKLVFLSANPAHKQESYIINPHQGEYDGKVWYSNSSYCRPKIVLSKGNYGRVTTSSGKKWDGYIPTSRDDVGHTIQKDEFSYVDPTTGEIHYYDVHPGYNSDDETVVYEVDDEMNAKQLMNAQRMFDSDFSYDAKHLDDPAFVRTWEELQMNTGYQTISDALEGLWAEIDDSGIFRCFDCEGAITVKGIKNCESDCEVADMMADSEYQAAMIQAEKDYDASQNEKSKKKVTKSKAKAKQQKLDLK